MNEYEFEVKLKREKGRTDLMSHGHVLDILSENDSKWSNVIRALLLGTVEMHISVSYLIDKIKYCRNHPYNPEKCLTYKNLQIFKTLQIK